MGATEAGEDKIVHDLGVIDDVIEGAELEALEAAPLLPPELAKGQDHTFIAIEEAEGKRTGRRITGRISSITGIGGPGTLYHGALTVQVDGRPVEQTITVDKDGEARLFPPYAEVPRPEDVKIGIFERTKEEAGKEEAKLSDEVASARSVGRSAIVGPQENLDRL